jgi:hypothetical protein
MEAIVLSLNMLTLRKEPAKDVYYVVTLLAR